MPPERNSPVLALSYPQPIGKDWGFLHNRFHHMSVARPRAVCLSNQAVPLEEAQAGSASVLIAGAGCEGAWGLPGPAS